MKDGHGINHGERQRLVAHPPAPLPVEAFVRGKPVEEVADLLPRLFNLCRHAQAAALNLALGLPTPDLSEITDEIRRDHIMRLGLILPERLGLSPIVIDPETPFGADGFPQDFASFLTFTQGRGPMAGLFRAVLEGFGHGHACSAPLPPVGEDTALTIAPLENSLATRHLTHPLMVEVAQRWGRGPLWRLIARALDLEAAVAGTLPAPRRIAAGTAIAPAARGQYAVTATVENGTVTALTRVTPTDHLLAAGGIMEQALASLPSTRLDQAALVVDILDPCVEVTVEGARHA